MTTPDRPESEAVGAARAEQRAAANPSASIWVSANAGTGKTRVLIDRVTRLMLAGTAPARILCLTFTKAAAAEMANRLHDTLGRWVTLADDALRTELGGLLDQPAKAADLPPARRLFAQVLDTPGGLKIMTIHAFCEGLLQRFPLEAGVAPNFDVMDERTAAELLEVARDQMLAAVGGTPALGRALDLIVDRVDEQGFANLVGDLASMRGKLRNLLHHHGGLDGLIAATRAALAVGERETEADVIAAATTDTAFDGTGLHRACAALDTGSAKDQERAAGIRAFLDADTPRPAQFERYARVFLTAEDKPRKDLITKQAQKAAGDADRILRDEQDRMFGVVERCKTVRIAVQTAALLRVGDGLLDAYQAEKRRRGLLDYDDLILTARGLLRQTNAAAWVLFKLDGGLDHILVDEAQDTSPDQWEVIAALAEEFFAGKGSREDLPDTPRTVFAVGDEKQSIYSFQGADPTSFEAMREHFAARVEAANLDWQPIDLDLSFRSTPDVLATVDAVFETDAARRGLTSANRPISHLVKRRDQAGLVELWPLVAPAEEPDLDPWAAPLDQVEVASPRSQLAVRIAEQIERMLAAGEGLAATGAAMRPGNIMILVRRRDVFVAEMVRQLKRRGVPVAGTDRMVLTEQIAVMDLIALGRFLLLPEDDLSLAEVLKGPLYGLDDGELFDLAYGRRDRLWQTLRAARNGNERVRRAAGELEELLARVDFVPPFEFYSDLLGGRGGRRRLVARLGPDAVDPIEEFLTLALAYERIHVPSMQGFLQWLQAGETQVKRDMEQGRNEVRVMTVHGAKGLQAPVVFLPDTAAVPGGRFDPRILSLPTNGAERSDRPLFLWPANRKFDDANCRAARAAAQAAGMDEYRRLLYVAMTRAEDRLYVCGWDTKQKRNPDSWYDLLAEPIRRLGQPVALPFGEPGWRIGGPPARADQPEAAKPPEAVLPDWATAAAPAEQRPPRPLAPSRPDGDEPPVRNPLAPDDGWRFRRGLLTHRLLQTLPELPPNRRVAAARRWLANPVHGLAEPMQRDIADEVMALLENPQFAPIFGPGSRAEVPLTGQVGNRVVVGQIDRLVVTEREVLVVDYKSNRPPPASPDQVPKIYLRQMAAYRALLRRIYPDRPIACALIWTDGARLMALPDAALDAAAS